MVRSEIDDIFASAGKAGKSATKSSGNGAAASTSTSKVKSTKMNEHGKKSGGKESDGGSKKVKGDNVTPSNGNKAFTSSTASGKRKAPELVVDPSHRLEAAATSSAKKSKKVKTTAAGKGLTEEDLDFMDSRGTNRKRTDDGLAIYSEAELKLDRNGGDTPLCPFDCDCCF